MGYNSRSLTPVGDTSPPARVLERPGWSVGSVIGFAPACRATGLTCVSGGKTGAGVKNRKLF